MKQYNEDIGNVIDEVLQQHTATIQFESVWNKASKNQGRVYSLRKVRAVPLIATMTLLCLFMAGFTYYKIFRNIDKTDYPFVDDSRVIGKWEAVDFVKNIEDFSPGKKSWKSDLYLTSLVFIREGQMLFSANSGNLGYTPATWTKDMILNKQDMTAGKYVIKEIDGSKYMFAEWKSGDYVFRNQIPWFYVLKNIDNKDYSDYQVETIKQDNVDYPFVDDAEVKGKWESVDFVKTIDSFKPGEKSWLDSFALLGLNFGENGKLTFSSESETVSPDYITWTKGMVLLNRGEEKTSSKCEIKNIDGTTYMFFEWKNGDYIYRGETPWYYVLKRVE